MNEKWEQDSYLGLYRYLDVNIDEVSAIRWWPSSMQANIQETLREDCRIYGGQTEEANRS
jgi:hypothetical protein